MSDCTSDTIKVDATPDEVECCSIKHKCQCQCSPKPDCKFPGANFEAILVRPGNNTPNYCCDLYMCSKFEFCQKKISTTVSLPFIDAISDSYSCHYNGIFYADKKTWKTGQCTTCTCDNRVVHCEEEKCLELTCEVKKVQKDGCCPTCTGECLSLDHDRYYESGQSWTEKDDCTHCTCNDGHKYCYSESCTPLSCANPVKTAGICCHYCKDEGKF
jgi:hypothetical protein